MTTTDQHDDEVTTLKAALKHCRRELSHLKRDLKKAKYRINTLKTQKVKLLKKVNPPPKRTTPRKPLFFDHKKT